ncbi:flagellar hook-length control protein FliK [Aureimonas leprariae]|uniref:Flagellar hook-length control protein FliK n=1 Tax=Plantimonas leprariae TaxID=2615207 RepID=A0A7V7PPI2_9HYPH|nr:flagellar hook-length control protein FliK [Aureimonas leprariae]KAB0679899.1 flagellar hook-length control protein FliK [Aureimonas leprariae]
MNVSMAAALFSVEATGGSQAPADAEAKREDFGIAVKDAAQKHGGKRTGAKDVGLRKDTKEIDVEPSKDAVEDDGSGGLPTPAELLGRLLGMTPAVAQVEQQASSPQACGEETAGDDAPDGALQERIVISTVADLANPSTGSGETSKRVALRVTGMETHFEPRLDGATLVEDAPSTPVEAAAVEKPAAAPKRAFADMLRRIGGQSTDTRAEGVPADAKVDASGIAADQAGGGHSEPEGGGEGTRREGQPSRAADRMHMANASSHGRAADAVVERVEPQAKGLSTGQIVSAQIAEHIVDAFASSSDAKGASEAPRSAAGTQQVLRMTAGGAALKTLSIQLEPQNLGRVDVAMRLVDGRLQVELAASEPSTAAALAGDRHGLRKILEHAGFALDDAAITIVSRDMGQGISTPAAGGTDGGGRASDGGSSFGRSSDGRSSGEERPSNGRRQQADHGDRGEPSARTKPQTGSVYL